MLATITTVEIRQEKTPARTLPGAADAAIAGVFRFGVSKKTFQPTNSEWAELAGFVGLPMCGFQTLVKYCPIGSSSPAIVMHPAFYLSMLVLTYTAIQANLPGDKNEKKRGDLRTLMAVGCFLLPGLYESYIMSNRLLAGSLLLFAFAGIAVGADRERYILGMRRENWFHYLIAIAAVGIGQGLSA